MKIDIKYITNTGTVSAFFQNTNNTSFDEMQTRCRKDWMPVSEYGFIFLLNLCFFVWALSHWKDINIVIMANCQLKLAGGERINKIVL